MNNQFVIHTDGSCLYNPGPGGWAAVISHNNRITEISDGEPASTSNRMELTAAVRALQATPPKSSIVIITDSQYLKNGVTLWIHSWKLNNWKNARKKPVSNSDLWRLLDNERSLRSVQWTWTPAHSGNPLNERADQLAKRAAYFHLKNRGAR